LPNSINKIHINQSVKRFRTSSSFYGEAQIYMETYSAFHCYRTVPFELAAWRVRKCFNWNLSWFSF